MLQAGSGMTNRFMAASGGTHDIFIGGAGTGQTLMAGNSADAWLQAGSGDDQSLHCWQRYGRHARRRTAGPATADRRHWYSRFAAGRNRR